MAQPYLLADGDDDVEPHRDNGTTTRQLPAVTAFPRTGPHSCPRIRDASVDVDPVVPGEPGQAVVITLPDRPHLPTLLAAVELEQQYSPL
jgi:hypothetical protein